ncbi:hypothetical protein CK203_040165 [Vitis vinifera]|uniref:Uncharacterized protein n=1 Tax=Vitis vinifera TaxID=29760 RepID=A0A438H2Y2_VITVI|nr:hypothetical protein CK203_040165 [Vitis vinifera]
MAKPEEYRPCYHSYIRPKRCMFSRSLYLSSLFGFAQGSRQAINNTIEQDITGRAPWISLCHAANFQYAMGDVISFIRPELCCAHQWGGCQKESVRCMPNPTVNRHFLRKFIAAVSFRMLAI